MKLLFWKDHITSPQQLLPTQRQILPAPPLEPSPQKTLYDNTRRLTNKPNQKCSKNDWNINLQKSYRDDAEGNVINLSKDKNWITK